MEGDFYRRRSRDRNTVPEGRFESPAPQSLDRLLVESIAKRANDANVVGAAIGSNFGVQEYDTFDPRLPRAFSVLRRGFTDGVWCRRGIWLRDERLGPYKREQHRGFHGSQHITAHQAVWGMVVWYWYGKHEGDL